MPIHRPAPQGSRVIAHVDMDCFYVQEFGENPKTNTMFGFMQRKKPELRGLPTAVVQYNAWKGGCLIAVGYEARKFGVKRSMRGDEAKEVCPDIQLILVPVARGKADLKSYRDAGSEVVSILSTKGRCERASIDEVYLDLTDAAESMLSETPPETLETIEKEALNSHILGLAGDGKGSEENVRRWFCRDDADHEDKLLACGAIIIAQLRIQVMEETQFTCSAGIAHNKMLAKLASAMHKPAQQTVVRTSAVKDLLASLPVKKMKQLGGKLGSSLQSDLGVKAVGDLLQFPVEKLQERYGTNTGSWLWNIARGISGEEVESRLLSKSHGSAKLFPGPQALRSTSSVEHWLNQLCEELSERIQDDLDQNKRIAHTLTLHAGAFKYNEKGLGRKFPSKSCPLRYGTAKIQEDAKKLFVSGLRDFVGPHNDRWGVTSLSVMASKILDIPSGTSSISSFFQDKGCHSLSSSGCDGFDHDHFPPSPSVNKIHTRPVFDMQQLRPSCEGISDVHETSRQNITFNIDARGTSLRKRKCKELGSILRYFRGSDSSTKQVLDEFTQADAPFPTSGQTNTSTSDSESYMELDPSEHQRSNLVKNDNNDENNTHANETTQTSSAWHLNVEDVDPSVIDELPLEIQREVRGWLRLPKRVQATKRGSDITQYFLPVKKQ
ncbi:putative DNA-directed DNA polymerase [Dioscorea sansibarensis]